MKTGFRVVLSSALLLMLSIGAGPADAQETPSPEGHWEGAIQVPGGELGINVDLMVEAGAWSGDISIPLQQTQDFPLSDVVVEGNHVSFAMAGVPGDPKFDGTISEDGQTLSGSFTQSGQNLEFLLSRESGGS